MGLRKVPLSRSIGAELLKKIFGIYCVVAIAITGYQAWSEYVHTRDRVLETMVEAQELVEDGLANAVWHLDTRLLEGLIRGLLSQSILTGVAVYTEEGELLSKGGTVEPDLDVLRYSETTGSLGENAQSVYRHQFALFDPNELSDEPVGYALFYSSRDVVIEAIQPTLYSLLIAAVVKTLVLWGLFLYFGRKLLSKPINSLLEQVQALPLKHLEELAEEQDKQGNGNLNELQLFQRAFTTMQRELDHTLAALNESNDKLANINLHLHRAVEQSPTLSSVISLDGRVIYSTPSLTELTGYSGEAIQALFDTQLLGRQRVRELVAEAQFEPEKSELWSRQLKVTTHARQQLYLQVSVSTVRDSDGNLENLLFSANDISALKKLALALKQKNLQQQETITKLEEAQNQLIQSEKMASIGQLAAGIAHEINNPVGFVNANMNIFSNYSEQLLTLLDLYEEACRSQGIQLQDIEAYSEEIDLAFLREDLPEMMNDTQEGLERIKRIVSDLMGFSRVGESVLSDYDLKVGIESTLNVASHELKYKVEIVKEFADLPYVECVPSQINQVLMNMMINAAHAIEERGVLTLRTGMQDENVWIEVEDTGCGIDPQNLSRLFDPFFTTKAVGEGTGLGLSVSYGIVAKHNGQIDVRSEPGKGTCFRIVLPVRQPEDSVLRTMNDEVAEVE